MKTITIAHQKGGVGKSTIVLNLAYAMKKEGFSVAIKDKDKQGTAYQCAHTVDVYINDENIDDKNYDFLLIDSPPYMMAAYADLFLASDLIIIPTRTGIADILAIASTIALFEKIQYQKPSLQASILFNAVDTRSNMLELLNPQLQATIHDVKNIKILKTVVENRVTYQRSLLDGEGIFSETDQKAQKEIQNLLTEILTLL